MPPEQIVEMIPVLNRRMVGRLEQTTIPDVDREGELAVLLRCPECGRGALARLVKDDRGVHPDGLIELQHLGGCPVLVASQREAS